MLSKAPKPFRFAIMGAGKIAAKFCRAVALLDDCEICAVASKSIERARLVANENALPAAYGDYALMLERERPDCVYIATTPDAHYALSLLCLEWGTPVLCEKAMFLSSEQAREVFERSEHTGVFAMEALWSRFLPANRRALGWLNEGRIGNARLLEAAIGFLAPPDPQSRYLNPVLGGGASYDLTVYAYEIADLFLGAAHAEPQVTALWGESGVTLTEHVALRYSGALASLTTTFAAPVDTRLLITGEHGRILVPRPHTANEAFLLSGAGDIIEHFRDDKTKNGFTYEIQEVIACIREGKTESPVVPHSLTLRCARLFDQIAATRKL